MKDIVKNINYENSQSNNQKLTFHYLENRLKHFFITFSNSFPILYKLLK